MFSKYSFSLSVFTFDLFYDQYISRSKMDSLQSLQIYVNECLFMYKLFKKVCEILYIRCLFRLASIICNYLQAFEVSRGLEYYLFMWHVNREALLAHMSGIFATCDISRTTFKGQIFKTLVISLIYHE